MNKHFYVLIPTQTFLFSPLCACGGSNKTVEHFFLSGPLFAALPETLFTFTAQKLKDTWLTSTKTQKIHWFLYGCPNVYFLSNVSLFKAVQSYIMQSSCFTY